MHRFVVLLLIAACGGSAKQQPVGNTGGTPSVAPVTLKDLQNGDRACYVVVTSGADEKSIEGEFDLCKGGPKDASALIGKPITYKTKKGKVLAASCEGNVDCGKSDEVDVVYEITAAP